jgi:hypothetical protein
MDDLHRALARRIGEDRRRYQHGSGESRAFYGRQVYGARLRVSEVEQERDAARARVAELEAREAIRAGGAEPITDADLDRGTELAEEWARGLADGQGRHVPVRRMWPELAALLDALVDGADR